MAMTIQFGGASSKMSVRNMSKVSDHSCAVAAVALNYAGTSYTIRLKKPLTIPYRIIRAPANLMETSHKFKSLF